MATKARSAKAPVTLNYSAVFQLEYQSGERAKIGVAGYRPIPNSETVALTVIRYSADGHTTNQATAVMTADEVAELCLCLQAATRSVDARNHSRRVSQKHRLI